MLVNSIAKEKTTSLVNTDQEVLVEFCTNNEYIGKTRTNCTVVIKSNKDIIGKIVQVKITGNKIHSLSGELK